MDPTGRSVWWMLSPALWSGTTRVRPREQPIRPEPTSMHLADSLRDAMGLMMNGVGNSNPTLSHTRRISMTVGCIAWYGLWLACSSAPYLLELTAGSGGLYFVPYWIRIWSLLLLPRLAQL